MARILVADDEKDVRALLVDTLEDAGYEVMEAEDGGEAFEIARYARPDLVLLDIMMPVMDGFEVVRRLKENPDTEAIPVVMLSAMSATEGERAAMTLGVPHYISKPWEPGAVELAIKVALREAGTEIANTNNHRRAQQMASIEGTVSVMFTDLEGSTAMLTRLGDEQNQALLRTHNNIIRQEIANHGGVEVKTMGDGFMIVFSSTRRVSSCAVDIQRSLQRFNQKNADR